MDGRGDPIAGQDQTVAAVQLLRAAEDRRCWACGCLHSAIADIEGAPAIEHLPHLEDALTRLRRKLKSVRVTCRECENCYPVAALDALVIAERRPSLEPDDKERLGWPPLPGDYTVLRYHAPVAVCTLYDGELTRSLVASAEPHIAIVGPLHTENLGIERLIQNVLANPNLRFLVVCGLDSRRAVGHLPGQAMMALKHSGIDDQHRIVGAASRRPVLANIGSDAIAHFRKTVEVVDCVGITDPVTILEVTRRCAAVDPGPAPRFYTEREVPTVTGGVSGTLTPDPAGYFVIYVERGRRKLLLEHYTNAGLLDVVIEGDSAAALYMPAISRNLLSRLDHAAYLGRELSRAERALQTGEAYVQDAAPEG